MFSGACEMDRAKASVDAQNTASRPEEARVRRRAVDPVALLVLGVAAVTYALHGFHGMLGRDTGLYAYAGHQVAGGLPPYVGVMNRAGPLAHGLPAIGSAVARIIGGDEVVAMRVVFLVFASATAAATYLLARDTLRSRVAGILGGAAFLAFHGFTLYASDGPREKTPMTMFVALAAWAAVRARWFSAGVMVSLATLCLQTAFFPSVAVVVVGALLTARGERGRALALVQVVLGAAVPPALCTLWFVVAGSLHEAIEGFVLINARYTVPDQPADHLGTVATDAVAGYGTVGFWLFVIGTLLVMVCAGLATMPALRRAAPWIRDVVPLAAGIGAGLAWDTRDYDTWPDLFPLLPFAAVGMGTLVPLAALVLRATRRPKGTEDAVGVEQWVSVVALIAAACVVAVSVQWSATHRNNVLNRQRAITRAVLAQVPPDATVTSIEAPTALVLAGRTNPTSYQMFQSGLEDYVDDTWPGGLPGFIDQLLAQQPTFIALGDKVRASMRSPIKGDYVCVASAPGWSWWADRDLGPHTLEALRRATAGMHPGTDDELDCLRNDRTLTAR
jgi:hypothetical protein